MTLTCPRKARILEKAGLRYVAAHRRQDNDARHRLVIVKPHLVAADEPASSTELTATGEQYVIPGCERNASPRAGQLDLFG